VAQLKFASPFSFKLKSRKEDGKERQAQVRERERYEWMYGPGGQTACQGVYSGLIVCLNFFRREYREREGSGSSPPPGVRSCSRWANELTFYSGLLIVTSLGGACPGIQLWLKGL